MKPIKVELKKAKNLLNKYAPKGEELAYINSKEATLLKRMGGAGKDINGTGIKSYFDPGSGRGSVSESLSEAAGLGSSSSNNSSSDNGNDNSPQKPRSILSRIGGAIKSAAATALTAATFGVGTIAAMGINKTAQYVTKNIGGTMTRTSYNPDNVQNRTAQVNMGGGDSGNNMSASNVGGKIVKLAPTSAEVSQSKATDVTYDSRKTKARGRSMTIRTNSRGIGNNMSAVLGKKSLLGAA